MRTHSLKPFDDGKYLSEEEAMKLLETIPIPKDDFESVDPAKEKPDIHVTENPDLENKIIQLDHLPADNGSKKSSEKWLVYWNNINDGRIFASMADYYLAFKQLNEKSKSGSFIEKQIAQEIIYSLREDFNWSKANWLNSSTRIKYVNQQNARIVHHYGSQSVPSVEHRIVIPGYPPDSLANVLDTNEGLRYLQALFGTQDNAQQIKDTLQELSDYPLNKIKVRSVRLLDRPTESVSGLRYNNGRFNVYTDLVYHSFGRSRAVHINITPKSRGSP